MAAGSVEFHKIPLGSPGRPVTAADLDRVQQAIVDMAATIQAPKAPNVVTVSSDYKLSGTEDVVHVDAQAGPVKITLLQPSSANRPVTIKQVNLQNGKSKVNQVTVATADGQQTIAGAASYDLDDTGTGAVSITADDQQHWPFTGSGGNPPVAPSGSGIVYVGIPPIYVAGNQIGIKQTPTPPPAPPVTPWPGVVPFGDGQFGSSTGAEVWVAESIVDFTGAPGSLTIYWWFQSRSDSGTATFNLRVGGSAFQAIDGAIAATWSEPSNTYVAQSVTTPGFTPPAGKQRVALTAKSSASGQKAQIQGVNLTFR